MFQILHLRGAVASLIKKPQYNLGNVPLELIIHEHTVIEVKGYYKETVDVNKTTVAVTWEEVGDMDQRCIGKYYYSFNCIQLCIQQPKKNLGFPRKFDKILGIFYFTN